MKATKQKTTTKAPAKKAAAMAPAPVAQVPAVQAPATGYNAAGGILAFIEQAARNPRVNVDKMEKLLSMQMTLMEKQAEIAYTQAMTRLQKVLPRITKKGRIKFIDKNGVERDTPYAKYEDIDKVIRPLLLAEGFTLTFDTRWTEKDGATIYGTLTHDGGHSKTSEMRLPLDTSGSKNNLQAMGSTISYGQRYLVKMLLNLIFEDEDDDGASFINPPDEGENFASRMTAQKNGGTIIDVDVSPLANQAGELLQKINGLKRKRDRLALVNDNLPLLRQLDAAGMADQVAGIHDAAGKGA